MTFEFELNGIKYSYDAEKECAIDTSDIQKELAEHPGKVAFISAVSAVFRGLVERKRLELESLYAKLDTAMRREATATGAKTTEKGIESAIITQGAYTKCQSEYLDILEKSRQAEACMETMKHRQFALVSLVSLMRTELSSVAIETMKSV